MIVILGMTLVVNGFLFTVIPKGFFPEEDTGRLIGRMQADQDISFQAMEPKLALSFGDGGELRRPLGITIVGGLMASQVLTLYTTPVLYLYLDRFRVFALRVKRWIIPPTAAPEAAE